MYIYNKTISNFVAPFKEKVISLTDQKKKIFAAVAITFVLLAAYNIAKCYYKLKPLKNDGLGGDPTDCNPVSTIDEPSLSTIMKAKPLNFDQVIQKANDDFALHPKKTEIVSRIEKRLKDLKYQEKFESGNLPITITLTWADNLYFPKASDPEAKEIILAATHFMENLPGVGAMCLE